MTLFYLPVELILHIGGYLSREGQISLATTCKAIRSVFMMQLFGGTIQIRSPLPFYAGLLQLFNFLHLGMPGLQQCIDQVKFYWRHTDLASSVHTVQMTNWTVPNPEDFCLAASRLADYRPQYQALLQAFDGDPYYSNALMAFGSVYDLIVDLVQFLPCSELRLIRTHITPALHRMLHAPALRTLSLEDCIFEGVDSRTYATDGGHYDSFKVTAGVAWRANHPLWNTLYTERTFIQNYLSKGFSTLTKLEVCIEFLHDDALDDMSLPSLTSLAIVPHANIICEMWSWRTVYRLLKATPSIACFRFEPLPPAPIILYPFGETTNWREYKNRIGDLPLTQLSSITAYRQLVKRLVPGRPVNFVKIPLFPEGMLSDINWPDAESDDEAMPRPRHKYIVPLQLVRSAAPITTLYLQRINEQKELSVSIWFVDLDIMRDACPFVTDLWLPSMKTTPSRPRYHNPADMVLVRDALRIWPGIERCAVGSCSPWTANELQWHREGTVIPERGHPTLRELLLDVVLWKWHHDAEVTGWVLYITTVNEGR